LDEIAEQYWKEYDATRMGVMDKIRTFQYCKKVLDTYNKSDAGCLPKFEQWFNSQDPNQTNQVKKDAIFAYMRQVAV